MGWNEAYFKGRERDFDQDRGPSHSNLLHVSIQITKSHMWQDQLAFGQLLVGLNEGWKEDPLDKLAKIVYTKEKGWNGL